MAPSASSRDGIDLGYTRTLDATGIATTTLSSLGTGTHAISATYSGATLFYASASTRRHTDSDQGEHGDDRDTCGTPPRMPRKSSALPSPSPLPPRCGHITGGVITVTFDGGAPLTGTLVSGMATITKADLTVGDHTVGASYGGDANFISSSATAFTQTVQCGDAITVANTNDSGLGSLRRAIDDLCPGGTITFDATAETIPLSSTLGISKSLTIDGAAGNVTMPTISGADAYRVFAIDIGLPVTMTHIAITNGRVDGNGAGIPAPTGSPITLIDVSLRNNHAVSVTVNTGLGGGADLEGWGHRRGRRVYRQFGG